MHGICMNKLQETKNPECPWVETRETVVGGRCSFSLNSFVKLNFCTVCVKKK